ncbi:hypothetical protein NliqN6_5075 [Naganishia liquefaciens]|uniref:DNA mismatch repair protein MSH3 n=1 Tax=Naganishia liquefaciens TaxID=104408 RepID=A0A8H3YGU5_9TREE|nr:hypothetical protein NliqN6_5075 [Naganishia liquefaciens]
MTVGIAAYDTVSGRIIITELQDNATFPKTIHHLNLHPPGIILVPDTAISFGSHNNKVNPDHSSSSVLVQCLESKFEIPCEGLAREFWSDTQGYQHLKTYIADDDGKQAGILVAMQDKYYGTAALGALFSYLHENGESFAPHSLPIEYKALEGTMFIDLDTATNLELIKSNLDNKPKNSLFGVMNKTHTKMAERLLRSTILQPVTVKEILEKRLDVVEELLENDALRKSMKTALKGIDNLDVEKLIRNFSRPLKVNDAVAAERRISDLLSLRRLIASMKMFAEALQEAQSGLLQTARAMLRDPKAEAIETLLEGAFNEDATVHQGKRHNYKAIRLYAIKGEPNGTLDIARKTHTEHLADIHQLKDDINEKYQLDLEVKYENDQFVLWGLVQEVEALPGEYTRGKKKGNKCFVNCKDLSKLNYRASESEQEIFKMCDQIVQSVSEGVVENIACLYNATEAIAKIDMFAGFAEICQGVGYTRPEFTGILAIKGGRHPILARWIGGDICIANDTYMAGGSSSFLLIQGANMSGKSTYLRQVALLNVTAMAGCFVPAEYASFRLHDALLSRLSNDESIEKSLSTFAAEMATSSLILGLATNESLVLLDELGRGTAPAEGFGICQAISEELIHRKSFVLFTTHFSELAETIQPFPGTEVLHMHSQMESRNSESQGYNTEHTYRVQQGPVRLHHYGLELAKLAGLPESVLASSTEVAHNLESSRAQTRASSESQAIAARRKTLIGLRGQLITVAESSKLNDADLRAYLRMVQGECVEQLKKTIEARNTAATN